MVVQIHDGQFAGTKSCSGVGAAVGQCSGGSKGSCKSSTSGVCEVTVDINALCGAATGGDSDAIVPPGTPVRPALPCTYDHAIGGGVYSEVATADGNFFACGEVASFIVKVTAGSAMTTQTITTLTVAASTGLVFKGATNNCVASKGTDTACVNGQSGVVSVSSVTGPILQIKGLAASSTTTFRLDFTLDCSKITGTSDLNVKVTDVKVGTASVSGLPADNGGSITNAGKILNCNDANSCTGDSTLGTSCNKYCQSIPKVCNDKNACTTDSCSTTDGTLNILVFHVMMV